MHLGLTQVGTLATQAAGRAESRVRHLRAPVAGVERAMPVRQDRRPGGTRRRAREVAGGAVDGQISPTVIGRAYLTQAHEMPFDADTHAFRAFSAVLSRCIYDRRMVSVDKILRGKARYVNLGLAALVATTCSSPWITAECSRACA